MWWDKHKVFSQSLWNTNFCQLLLNCSLKTQIWWPPETWDLSQALHLYKKDGCTWLWEISLTTITSGDTCVRRGIFLKIVTIILKAVMTRTQVMYWYMLSSIYITYNQSIQTKSIVMSHLLVMVVMTRTLQVLEEGRVICKTQGGRARTRLT